ncbi:hypothetical protein J1792_06800 [Streptomyces triculaminicus]|uniref:Uncharacterized protein n=1 Tax=Streptomyces triculaminicus TaxID=2816232 RepID=A0A939FKQ1_9ACTN|nr:DUF6086 family protein [Streptomyces triculaminicus]MBO0652504.1 hypothetical protein [Streptomyces triculaminicus]
MSCYFQTADEDLWNPSNSVARLFLDQANTLARLIDRKSGLGPIIEDECEINFPEFLKFVDSLVEAYQNSNNRPFRALLRGFISVALVLVERGGGVLESVSPEDSEMWENLRSSNALGMPKG